jgi:2-C-methyl-D-erythritol 2,4-cyclodiphosphate synthase
VSFRVGHGFDAHRLGPGRPLVLGGVTIPHHQGLIGHSDGDCLTHALCDALLGAAACGDMGEHFPSCDVSLRGAASLGFLEQVVRLLSERGFVIENVDLTVVAEAPRLSGYLAAMCSQLAACLGLSEADVSVKAKSTDGLGALGRAEGVAALATVLLRRP